MKFIPVASTSPKIQAREILNSATPIELIVIDDPKNGQRYLSFGIGTTNIRRTWLTPKQVMRLIEKIAILTPKLWSE